MLIKRGHYPYCKGEVGICNLGKSHFLRPEGYFDFIVEPKNWL